MFRTRGWPRFGDREGDKVDTPLYDSQDYDTDEAVQYRELRERIAADVLRNKVDGARREPRRPYLQITPYAMGVGIQHG